MTVSEDLLQRVWQKGAAADFDPKIWRKDECGAWISRIRHGDKNSLYGWEIDHIDPDGFDDPSNLRRCNGKTVLTTRKDSENVLLLQMEIATQKDNDEITALRPWFCRGPTNI